MPLPISPRPTLLICRLSCFVAKLTNFIQLGVRKADFEFAFFFFKSGCDNSTIDDEYVVGITESDLL